MNENFGDYDFSADCDDADFREKLEKAKGGDAEAMCGLGGYYSNLFYVEDDLDEDFEEKAEIWDLKALYWYEKAAALGNVHAHFRIGSLYDDGNGIDRDYEKAAHWYRAAAEQGHDWAQFSLGTLYEKGVGVEKNHEQAVYWFTKAAEQGHGLACEYLGVCYRKGEGVEQDIQKAVYWLIKADEGGVFGAWEKLEEIIQEPNAAETYGFASEMDKIHSTIERHKKDIEEFKIKLERQRAEFNEMEFLDGRSHIE
jgi:TPR repeat protein